MSLKVLFYLGVNSLFPVLFCLFLPLLLRKKNFQGSTKPVIGRLTHRCNCGVKRISDPALSMRRPVIRSSWRTSSAILSPTASKPRENRHGHGRRPCSRTSRPHCDFGGVSVGYSLGGLVHLWVGLLIGRFGGR